MDLLKRKLAPISESAWQQIDDEAKRVLKLNLAGRKLVDFSGPHGWGLAGVNTGRLTHIQDAPVQQVGHAIRDVRPLVELRAQIVLDTMELDYAARGAKDLDLEPLVTAAEHIARAEDNAIFHGFKPGGITGIVEASPHAPIEVQHSVEWPRAISAAKEVLRRAGIDGPYALAACLRRDHLGGRGRLPAATSHRGGHQRRHAGVGAGARLRRRADLYARRRLRAHRRSGPVDRLHRARSNAGGAVSDRVFHVPRAREQGRRFAARSQVTCLEIGREELLARDWIRSGVLGVAVRTNRHVGDADQMWQRCGKGSPESIFGRA
jgi:hypothetical protein